MQRSPVQAPRDVTAPKHTGPRSTPPREEAAGPLRVLWVTDDWGAPARYRCLHGAEQLRAVGIPANVMHLDDPGLFAALPSYSVVVLFRLPWSARVDRVLASVRRNGATPVFEVDDLIFDPSFEPLLAFLRDLRPGARREYRDRFRRLRRTFEACDVFLGSTPALAHAAVSLGRREAFHHPNLVPTAYEELARWLRWRGRMTSPTIAYLSGSNTHDRDFAVVSDALAQVLLADPQVRLLVCGFLELPAPMRAFEGRIVRVPYQDWRLYPWLLAGCAVTLAPMAVVNAFADAKSALKFFEPGIFGVPVVATPTAPFRDAITDGETGFLASTPAEWHDRIRRALDPAVGGAVGARARDAVLARHTQGAHAGRLAAILRPFAGRAGVPPPALALDAGWGASPPLPRGEYARRAWSLLRGRAPVETPGAPAAPLVQALDPAPFDRVIHAVDAASPERISTVRPVQHDVARDPEAWARWQPSPTLVLDDEGRYRSATGDGVLESPLVDIPAAAYRWLVVRMAATADVPAPRAWLGWSTGGGFHETAGVSWTIQADGEPHTWVIDLCDTTWARNGRVTGLRLRPLDRPGVAVVGHLLLLADLTQLDGDDVTAALARRHLRGVGVVVDVETPALAPAAQAARVDGAAARALADAYDFVVAATPMAAPVRPGGTLLVVGPAAAEAMVPGWDVVERAADAVVLRRPLADDAPRPTRPVDIVVPIFNAREQVIACLESVLRHARGDWRLVPVDDASTDATLAAWLDDLDRREPRVRLLRNPENLGFVGTANHGMREAGDRDVLLLNSDTVVSEGFIEGLQSAAYAGGPAIVSPLSNNATILSVPEFCADNPLPAGYGLEDFAALVARTSLRRRTVLPTAHGFCMYVPAVVLATVGPFDHAHFGRGFGEENDLCERARAAGFPSVVADDVYVWHAGSASFGDDAAELLRQEHYHTLRALHPEYFANVARFVEANPLAPVLANLQLALRRRAVDTPALLCVLHASFDAPAGGTEHHVRDLIRGLRLPRVVVAAALPDGIHLTEVFDGRIDEALRYRFPLAQRPDGFMLERPEMEEALRTIVGLFGVGAVHFHQLCNWPVRIWRTVKALGVPYVVTCHDYYPASPNVNLYDAASERLCCLEAGGTCAACLPERFRLLGLDPPADPTAYLARHRDEFRQLLAGAERVFFPAERTREIMRALQVIDPARTAVVPHGYLEPSRRARPQAQRRPLNVALLGEVAYPTKGARDHLRLIERTRDLPIVWHVFGEAERFGYADALRALGLRSRLRLHGWYPREAIFERLAAAEIDLVVFLPPWPETFSYSLSEALVAGVPVLVSDQGALPERVRAGGVGAVARDLDEAAATLQRLLAQPDELERMTAAAQRYRHRSLAEMADAYRPYYATLLERAAIPVPPDRAARARLAELHQAAAPPAPAASHAPAPVLPHYNRGWYRYYRHVAHLVPERVRRWGREQVVARWWRTVRALRFGAAYTVPTGLELVRTGGGRATYRALHDDPSFVLQVSPFRSREVRVIRFSMRYEARGATFAQVYWSHTTGEPFSEDKSLRIPLTDGDGAWHEYAVVIDQSSSRATWDEGDEIRHLRFDPINAPGTVELAEFRLCAPADG